jgi:hypothetical protein
MKVQFSGAAATVGCGLIAVTVVQARAAGDKPSLEDMVKGLLATIGDVVDPPPPIIPCGDWARDLHMCKEQFIINKIILNQEHIQYGQIADAKLPHEEKGRHQMAYNCDPDSAFGPPPLKRLPTMQISATRQTQKQQGYTATSQYSVTNTVSMQLSGGALTVGLLSFGGTIQLQGSIAKIYADARTNTDAWSGGTTFTADIAPQSMMIAHITDIPTTFTIPFTVDAIVDAEIWAGAHNPEQQLLSTFIPSPEKRRITFKGEIVVNDFTVSKIVPDTIKL